jgi:hypothetical protein
MSRIADARFTNVVNAQDACMAMCAAYWGGLGVGLFDLLDVLLKMAVDAVKYHVLAIQCTAAAIQVRANVTFTFVPEARDFPVLQIQSNRSGIADVMNFKALHVLGHMMAAICPNHIVGRGVNAKGNCVVGYASDFPDSAAGKINQELRSNFTDDDIARFRGNYAVLTPFVESVYDYMVNQRKLIGTASKSMVYKAPQSVPPRPDAPGSKGKGKGGKATTQVEEEEQI